MQTPIQNIKLSFSCKENWNNMSLCEQGKVCQACNKKVYDFTNKTHDDFKKVMLKNNGKLCGRFRKKQTIVPKAKISFNKFIVSLLLTIGLSSISKLINAQVSGCDHPEHDHEIDIDTEIGDDLVLGMVMETMPVYKYGGDKGLYEFVQKNIIFPEDSLDGKVYLSFVVDTSGKVIDPVILKSLSPEADSESLRVVKLLEFEPGIIDGKPVAIKYNLPINFKGDHRKK